MEGVRRHDEFQRAAALVPDDARLRRTGAARTDPDDEDPDFATFVWNELDRCGTASACEAALGTDPYRVRRLAAQWLEQGALAL